MTPRSVRQPALTGAIALSVLLSCAGAPPPGGGENAGGTVGTTIARAQDRPDHAPGPRDAAGAAPPPAVPGGGVTVCSQNLWNYGAVEDVRRYRRPSTPIEKIRADLEAQDRDLAERLDGCDIVAVQEVLGGGRERALEALRRLSQAVSRRTGNSYAVFVGEARDVIRNGFLVRDGLDADGARLVEGSPADRIDPIPGYPHPSWERDPAEIVLEIPAGAGTLRLRLFSAHLKSKRETESDSDPTGEKWERLRIVQAASLLSVVRRRLAVEPSEPILVAADVNNVPGSAVRAVLTGTLDPLSLLTPRDCIGEGGRLSCRPAGSAPLLVELAADDPDLAGRGSFRYHGRDELIDEIFATPAAAALAREPGGGPSDSDVSLIGRRGRGSDHLMLRVHLALPTARH